MLNCVHDTNKKMIGAVGNEQRKQWMWEKIERCEKKMVRCRKGGIKGRIEKGQMKRGTEKGESKGRAEEDRNRERDRDREGQREGNV